MSDAHKIVSHTPGPWCVENCTTEHAHDICLVNPPEGAGSPAPIAFCHYDEQAESDKPGYISAAEAEANARLMAAAPDHALLAKALCSGLARWSPFDAESGQGEICVGGLRYATRLDEFGVPALSDVIRSAIARARS